MKQDIIRRYRGSHGPDGWIYAAREAQTPLVKIGCARYDIARRLTLLATTEKVALTLLGKVYVRNYRIFAVEWLIHDTLQAQRIQGEWFYLHMTQAWLEQLVANAMREIDAWHRMKGRTHVH
jgi:Meiotically up-regulated gene 113